MSKSDELHKPKYFRLLDINNQFLYALNNDKSNIRLDTILVQLIRDSRALLSTKFSKEDSIPSTYKSLLGVTISRITSSLGAAGIDSVRY